MSFYGTVVELAPISPLTGAAHTQGDYWSEEVSGNWFIGKVHGQRFGALLVRLCVEQNS